MFNLYSRHTATQNTGHVRYEVTGHDRFGHVGAARRSKKSTSAPTFTPSPKWRIQREALLRQQSQAERWRRVSGTKTGVGSINSGYNLLPTQDSSVVTDGASNDLNAPQAKNSNSRSLIDGFTWLRRFLQQLFCRSQTNSTNASREHSQNQTNESLDHLIPRWVLTSIYFCPFW